ncbi:MAG: hypothetical protein K8T90_18115, partial [Planctomycetes bacterium]|nr:hypothetical protein [Planctomycetota bacterium]
AGKRIEIRDLADNVVLYGEIPAVETTHDVEPVHETEHAEDPETGTDVDVVVRIEPEHGNEEVVIVVRDIPRETDAAHGKRRMRRKAELRMDDGTGNVTTVAQARVRGSRARIRITTRGGRELPLGVESLRDLAGRGFDVVVGSTRTVSGSLPQF